MKTRVNVLCRACGWSTSRAPKPDHDYGRCRRCDAVLQAGRIRRYVERRATTWVSVREGEVAADKDLTPRYADQNATWPELVAAELEREETAR